MGTPRLLKTRGFLQYGSDEVDQVGQLMEILHNKLNTTRSLKTGIQAFRCIDSSDVLILSAWHHVFLCVFVVLNLLHAHGNWSQHLQKRSGTTHGCLRSFKIQNCFRDFEVVNMRILHITTTLFVFVIYSCRRSRPPPSHHCHTSNV